MHHFCVLISTWRHTAHSADFISNLPEFLNFLQRAIITVKAVAECPCAAAAWLAATAALLLGRMRQSCFHCAPRTPRRSHCATGSFTVFAGYWLQYRGTSAPEHDWKSIFTKIKTQEQGSLNYPYPFVQHFKLLTNYQEDKVICVIPCVEEFTMCI